MFYDNLTQACKQHDTDVMNLTHELEIPRTTVYAWKRNGYTPRPAVVAKIAKKLDMEPDKLTGAGDGKTKTDDPKKALLGAFKNLNAKGQKAAVARVRELGEISRYAC